MVAALPWLLVSHLAIQECRQEGCTPAEGVPPMTPHVLGEYARQETCEQVAATLSAL